MKWIGDYAIDKTINLFGWSCRFAMREAGAAMGRLGGGWNWQLGIMYYPGDIVFNLFIASIRIKRIKK